MAAAPSIISKCTAASTSRSERLSKAIGALGGYVCGTRDLIDFLYHRARPFLFSTSHPPSVAATCIAAFDVLENEPERIEKLWENTRFWKRELGLLGFDIGGKTTPASETPITPIIIGDGKLTMDFSRELFKEGVLGTGIAFPTVPEGKARIRTIMTATHTQDELQQALEVLEASWEENGDCELEGVEGSAAFGPEQAAKTEAYDSTESSNDCGYYEFKREKVVRCGIARDIQL